MGSRTGSDRQTQSTEEKKLIVPSQAVMNFMRPVHVGFMVDKVGLGQVCSKYVGFSLTASFHQSFVWTHSSATGAIFY